MPDRLDTTVAETAEEWRTPTQVADILDEMVAEAEAELNVLSAPDDPSDDWTPDTQPEEGD